MEVEDNFLG